MQTIPRRQKRTADRTCRQSHEDKKEQQTEHADNPTWTKKNSRQNMQTIPRRQKRTADRTFLSRQARERTDFPGQGEQLLKSFYMG